jgi:type IV pilus assembly protein PilE
MKQMRTQGFSLIELMITVAIVGLLAGVAYPSYVSYVNKGKRAECRSGVMQVMQQQERYFTQFNRYATATWVAGADTALVKTYSGDNKTASACKVNSVKCTAPGDTSDNMVCVEARALPVGTDPLNIDYIYVDSDGRKGCSVSGTRTSSNKNCWP